jgi:hypothetical protein
MAPKIKQATENVSLGPATREGENVFGVCHIFASFNDSELHSTAYFVPPWSQPYSSVRRRTVLLSRFHIRIETDQGRSTVLILQP